MKKTLSITLVLALLLSAVLCVSAENTLSGICGEGITWSLNEEGVLTVIGEGAMQNYSENNHAPWHDSLNLIYDIIISDGITSIGDYAFYPGIDHNITLSFTDSLKNIGNVAFLQKESKNPQWGSSFGISMVYYNGSKEDYDAITFNDGNTAFDKNTTVYYQKVSSPVSDNYWDRDADKKSDINWTLDKSGTLTLTGSGDMPFSKLSGLYIDKNYNEMYDQAAKKLVVTDGITTVGNFDGFSNLTEVVLPETVKTLSDSITLTVGKTDATVFGESKTSDVAPLIRNSRTMLPARFVVENLGASVSWNAETSEVTIHGKNLKTNADTEIIIKIGADTATVNGEKIVLDAPAFIENGRTYTPVRILSENLGASVSWMESTKQVVIKRP